MLFKPVTDAKFEPREVTFLRLMPRAVQDDRLEVQNDPPCTSIGFTLSDLSREDRI